MPEFAFTELLALGPDTTVYRLLTTDGVSTIDTAVGTFLRVEPEALTLLTETFCSLALSARCPRSFAIFIPPLSKAKKVARCST